MKVLVLAQNYPYPGHPLAAPFNEHSVKALRNLCEGVEVLVPRPYAPPVLSALVHRSKPMKCARAFRCTGQPTHNCRALGERFGEIKRRSGGAIGQ
jgi:hypothetical protein